MRLGFQDEGFDKTGVDKNGHILYGPSGNNDAHSMTGFNVFCEPLGQQIIDIVDDSGKKISFLPEQKIKIKRKNLSGEFEEMTIKGDQFTEYDEWVNYV